MSYEAIIFDLDGTLIDSERISFLVYRDLCAEFGKTYTPEHHVLMMGRSSDASYETLRDVVGVSIAREDFNRAKEAIREKLFQESLAAKPGVIEFLASLTERGYKLGIATASAPEYRERALGMTGIGKYFSEFESGQEVAHPKPAPDIYLAVAEKFGVDPSRCLAVEDAPAGIESGRAAGMDVLGIRDTMFLAELSGATKTIDSFEEITVSDVDAMGEK